MLGELDLIKNKLVLVIMQLGDRIGSSMRQNCGSIYPFLPIFQFCDVTNHGGNHHPTDDLAKFGYE